MHYAKLLIALPKSVLPASKYVPFSANKDDPKSANKDA